MLRAIIVLIVAAVILGSQSSTFSKWLSTHSEPGMASPGWLGANEPAEPPPEPTSTLAHSLPAGNADITPISLANEVNDLSRSTQRVEVLQTLIELPLTGDNETELLQQLRSWSKHSAKDAALWIEVTLDNAAPGSAAHELRHSLLYLWLEIEPEAALARLASLADPDELPHLIADHVVRLASQSSPAVALHWAESSPEGPVRKRAVSGALDHWLKHDAEGLAVELLARIEEERQTPQNAPQTAAFVNHLGQRLVDALAERAPEHALKLTEKLPRHQSKAAQKRIVGTWLDQDAESARQWLTNLLANTGTLPNAVASAIPSADIELAMTTWNTIEGPARKAMAKGIVETLSSTDPSAAQTWIHSLDELSLREHATQVWIGTNASQMPTEALTAVLASPPDARRSALLIDTAATVANSDPELLREWLTNAPLSEFDHKRISALVLDR